MYIWHNTTYVHKVGILTRAVLIPVITGLNQLMWFVGVIGYIYIYIYIHIGWPQSENTLRSLAPLIPLDLSVHQLDVKFDMQ